MNIIWFGAAQICFICLFVGELSFNVLQESHMILICSFDVFIRLFEGVCLKLPSSWPPVRVEGGSEPQVMTPDPQDPWDPLMN